MRTLVVEDAASIRRLLETLLEERAHDVIGVEDAEAALEIQLREPADLLLVDLGLPGMSGAELIRRVRAGPGGDGPVIVAFTGRPDREGLEGLLEAGIDDYLTKPLEPEVLRRRILIAEAHVRDSKRRQEAEARAQQAGRMASVGALAAGVTHELNNPLSAVVSNLQLLADELEGLRASLPEDRAQALAELVVEAAQGAGRMRGIVRDLKTFSRMDPERHGPLRVEPVLEASLGMARNQIRHRARLARSYERAPMVDANESRLAQVFLNLLLHAAAAIPEGQADDHSIEVRVGTWTDGGAVVEIADTGRGLDPEARAHVFDPYYATEQGGGATAGLGLSVCHNIVEGLGGSIEVESAPERGSRFRVLLPAASHEAVVPGSGQPLGVAQEVRSARVLVVDDEPLVARSLRRALRGNEVVIADSGQDALQLLATDHGFDVILCDIMMPDVSGIEVYEQVCVSWPGLAPRFVFMTGGAFTERARAFLDALANTRIDKPFDLEQVRAVVRAVAEGTDR